MHDREVELGLFADRDGAVRERARGRMQQRLGCLPVVAVRIRVAHDVLETIEKRDVQCRDAFVVAQAEDGGVQRRAHAIREGRDRERDACRARVGIGTEVPRARGIDQQCAVALRKRRIQQREQADEPVLVEVIVRDRIHVHVETGRVEIGEGDGGRGIALERRGRTALGPVRQGQHRGLLPRPVHDDVRPVAEFGIWNEFHGGRRAFRADRTERPGL